MSARTRVTSLFAIVSIHLGGTASTTCQGLDGKMTLGGIAKPTSYPSQGTGSRLSCQKLLISTLCYYLTHS